MNIDKLNGYFSEYGKCYSNINEGILHIIFYDHNLIKREIFIGEKTQLKPNAEYIIWINTIDRLKQGINVATIYDK